MQSIQKYDRAKMRICQYVADNALQIGERLPSERELVEMLNLSPVTVRRALSELAHSGIIGSRPRQGNFLLKILDSVPDLGDVLYLHIFMEEYGEKLLPDVMRNELEALLRRQGLRQLYYNASAPDLNLAKIIPKTLAVFVTGWLNEEWRTFLQGFGIPVIVLGSNPFAGELPTVVFDWEQAAFALTEELIRGGCRHIGLLNGGNTYYPAQMMSRGFHRAMRKAGRTIAPGQEKFVESCMIDHELADFFAANPQCDAILAETGALSSLLASLWVNSGDRNMFIAVPVDNRDMLLPLSLIPNSISGCFSDSIPAKAVQLLLDFLENKREIKSVALAAEIVHNYKSGITHREFSLRRQHKTEGKIVR